jgi:hypothetical protein
MAITNQKTYDLKIDQGTTFILGLTIKKPTGVPLDLTDYTARCQIRKTHSDPIVVAEPLITLDPDRKSGKVTVSLSELDTRKIQIKQGVYDLELIDPTGNIVLRILEGKVFVTPEVTR